MRKYTLAAIFLGDFILSFVLAYFLLANTKSKAELPDQLQINNVSPSNEISGDPSMAHNILILGYGGAGHDGGNLSDVVMVASLNSKSRKVTFVTIPRDLWVEIPIRSDIGQNFKINAAYAIGTDDKKYGLKEPQYRGKFGGGTMAKKVVSEVAGLPIHNFVAIDFDSFKKLVDTLGGIDVEVPVAFDDYSYPVKGLENETCGFSADKILELHQKNSGYELERQFTCRYEHLHFDKGKAKLDGNMALKFVRSRHSAQDGGDFARSRRQSAVLLGVRDRLFALEAIKNIDKVYGDLSSLVTTDLDLSAVKKISSLIGSPNDYSINFASITTENVLAASKSLDGQFILIPKEGENVWLSVQKYIFEQIN